MLSSRAPGDVAAPYRLRRPQTNREGLALRRLRGRRIVGQAYREDDVGCGRLVEPGDPCALAAVGAAQAAADERRDGLAVVGEPPDEDGDCQDGTRTRAAYEIGAVLSVEGRISRSIYRARSLDRY